jgi:hypothetical protein
MEEYKLTTKSGDILKKTKAESLEEAIEIFSDIKKLPPEKLLSIFLVEVVE